MTFGPKTTRYTLKDVAERAGVAVSTASLVFSGKRHVAQPTRDRVLKAAAELDYGGPNPLASSLRQGRTGIVGVFAEGRLLNSFRDPFTVSVLDGLAQYLGNHASGIFLIPAQSSDPREVVQQISGIPLDAVTFPLGGHVSPTILEHLRARRIPLVSAGFPNVEGILTLELDERGAMRQLAQHLHDLGHRRVATIQLPPAQSPSDDDPMHGQNPEAALRTEGFLEIFPDAQVLTAESSSIEGGFDIAHDLLEKAGDNYPTAIAAQSDLLAVGAIQAIGAAGLSTPGDISVTGFDGIELPWLTGTLTTIDQRGTEKGRAIGAMVQSALEGNRSDRAHEYELIVGTSTDAPRHV